MPQQIKTNLKQKLKKAERIAFLAVGSELHADDAAGILVGRKVEAFPAGKKTGIEFRVFFGHTAPENLTGEIKKFRPTHIVILDAADMQMKPGEACLIDLAEESGVSFSTHRLPTKILADYLAQSLSCRAILVGIQPKSIIFGKGLSKEVKASCQELAELLREVVFS